MELPLDTIICGDNCDVLGSFPRACIDLVVTSPPYDDLRTYGGHSWDFYGVAWQLKRVLKPGGVIVWVVADATKDGSETGTSMRQALHFQSLGLNLHDTMIYEKAGGGAVGSHFSYWQFWDFMFVLTNGRPAAVNRLKDRHNVSAGHLNSGSGQKNEKVGTRLRIDAKRTEEIGIRSNIWKYGHGNRHGDNHDHPAPFPEALARDHILSWSNEGDIVLDPFNGSGTTTKMARKCGRRYIGIDVNESYCEIARKRLQQQLLPI